MQNVVKGIMLSKYWVQDARQHGRKFIIFEVNNCIIVIFDQAFSIYDVLKKTSLPQVLLYSGSTKYY